MRDPFPIPPPQPLVNAIRPVASGLSLSTLPLHFHEVIFAFSLYTFTCTVVSPFLSKRFAPEKYNSLSKRTKINWDVHVVSFVQSCIICALSLYVILFDEERKTWRAPERWEDRIWGYSGLTGLCQSFGLGYFLWDFVMCAWHVEIFGWGMLAHAISALSVFSFGYRPFLYFYAPVFLLYELSSPFLNIHWFCDKLDLTGSAFQAINGITLTATFFACRLVWGVYSSFKVANDVITALSAGHATRKTGILGEDVQMRNARSADVGLYYMDAGKQTGAFRGEEYLPLWLAVIYLAANLTLNVLNVFWFGKMIATIRKRFDPPFGTKGIGPDEVHWEPHQRVLAAERKKAEEERRKTEALHAQGKGSVKAGREKAEEMMNGSLNGEEVNVQRGVYADGHKSVEVTGTTRRSARSRRKA